MQIFYKRMLRFHWTKFWICTGVNVKLILSIDDVKSTVIVAKPGFTPLVSVNIPPGSEMYCGKAGVSILFTME